MLFCVCTTYIVYVFMHIESNSILLNSGAHILCDNRNNISLNLNIEFPVTWRGAATATATTAATANNVTYRKSIQSGLKKMRERMAEWVVGGGGVVNLTLTDDIKSDTAKSYQNSIQFN